MSRVHDLLYAAHGQCRLVFISATQVRLQPHNGRNLNINGLPERIPEAGVNGANTGLAANTTFYVYAWMNGATMALEFSTTARATHTNGVQIKSGDPTRTLVGMVRTNGSSEFADTSTARHVISWFNRRTIHGATATVSGSTASTGGFAEITASGQISFVTWSDEAVEIFSIGAVSSNSSGNILHSTSQGLDGAAFGAQSSVTTFAASVSMPAIARAVAAVSEGRHVASTFGQVSGGTGTWNFGTQLIIQG